MKLPALDELTDLQREVYLYAPINTNVLVSGPPGCGKTLIAGLRAEEMAKRGVPTRLAMFSRVLKRYTQGQTKPAYTIITINQFFAHWIKKILRPMLNNQFEINQFVAKNNRFIRWEELNNYLEDYLKKDKDAFKPEVFSFGYLIIDEGQDFPPSFYNFLTCLSFIGDVVASKFPLKCLVLADENQKLTDWNSTLEEIATILDITEDHHYKLIDNFRNSYEVAVLAKSFFAKVGTIPVLPTRKTEQPELIHYNSVNEFIDYLNVWLRNHPGKEVGVFCFREPARVDLCKILNDQLVKRYKLQTYSSKTSLENPAEKLIFDETNTLTLLNVQSCKGLEFDAVFLINPSDMNLNDQSSHLDKMTMFVASSRARDIVKIINYNNFNIEKSQINILPDESVLKRVNWSKQYPIQDYEDRWDWNDKVMDLVSRYKLDYVDLRNKGGCYWVYTGKNLSNKLEPLGFKFSQAKGAWWYKGDTHE